tara:strand:+ start:239 stop:490 length:252 start_codon:yes stop_codon:yes gene_type:complete
MFLLGFPRNVARAKEALGAPASPAITTVNDNMNWANQTVNCVGRDPEEDQIGNRDDAVSVVSGMQSTDLTNQVMPHHGGGASR